MGMSSDMDVRLGVVTADITTLALDAIVNAANASLLGGGGVDGAIHRKAGPELLEACRRLNGCRVGEAKLTPGFKLPAAYVIHTVGPVWSGGQRREPELLASCYRASLELAVENRLRTIAFPAISTGVYRYPPDQAARIAVDAVAGLLRTTDALDRVVFCCFSESSARSHQEALARLSEQAHG